MSFILDTDICSAHLRGDRRIAGRFLQYTGGLYVSAVTLGELYAWMHLSPHPERLRSGISDLLSDVRVLPVNAAVAERFGALRGELHRAGTPVATSDLLIAATASERDFTVVTHNVKHFNLVPRLRVVDWLAPYSKPT